MEETHVATTPDVQRAVSRRLDELAWALFLILIGAIWLMPAGTVPEGAWLERISEPPPEDLGAGELEKAEEVLGLPFPTADEAPLPE